MKTLHKAVQEYLSIRRALGFKLERAGLWLPHFASFVKLHRSEFITVELAVRWASLSLSAGSRARRLAMVRKFAEYLCAKDSRTEIPAPSIIPARHTRFTPYIYSLSEIRELMRACRHMIGSVKPHTYETLIGLLAVTGMRLGEALSLNCEDINEHQSLITIRHGKFGKSRQIPIHPTTLKALQDYAKRRDHVFRRRGNPSFFLSQAGTRVRPQNVWFNFNRLRRRACLNRINAPNPRLHDLRHTFAVRTLTRWYRDGVEVERRLAVLSTYLGHVSPLSTYWYLTGTPELMALTTKRLERSLGELL